MRDRYDLSIGQRLSIGFGVLLLLLAVIGAAMLESQGKSARAEELYLTQVLPVRDGAITLERAILYVAIDVRAYLLELGPESLTRFRSAVERVRETVTDLRMRLPEIDRASLDTTTVPIVEQYLREAEGLVVVGGAPRDATAADERMIAAARERAIHDVSQFVQAQDTRARQALAAISDARRDAIRGVVGGSIVAILMFLAVAVVTTQSVRQPAADLVQIASAVHAGDWQPALAWSRSHGSVDDRLPRSEMLQLAYAFGGAALALRQREHRLRADEEVATAAGSSLSAERIAAAILRIVTQHVRADAAVIYARDHASDFLTPIASYALGDAAAVRVGVGIPGQAALDREPVIVRDLPPDTPFSVRLGYDAAPPRAVAALPITFHTELMGVLLVATTREFDDQAIDFLKRAALQGGVALHNARSYEDAQRLLVEVRRQNDRIQSQNEELQAQNEEIQAQADQMRLQTEELQAQHEEIEAQNDELRLHDEELLRKSELLSEADRQKNHFLGVLAHELRNPLAAITSSVFLLGKSGVSEMRTRRALAVVRRQTQQLTRLIDDLLDITRISNGKIVLELQRVELTQLLRACADDYAHAFEDRGLQLEIDPGDVPIWTRGDPTRLAQIVGNLLNNSVKFTEQGGRVTISVSAQNGRATVRVADTGIGIGSALLPLLFEPFTQDPDRYVRSQGGLGLGLALVKALVELHGGSVNAHSDGPGTGAEFVVVLPLLEPAHRRTSDQSGAVARIQTRVTRRVLIVDDDVDAAHALAASLELEGHHVIVATSGEEALQRARVTLPEIVVCDLAMPNLDGYAIARRFRADEALREVRLVALTGFSSSEDRQKATEAGFDRYLTKPADIDDLTELFAKLTRDHPTLNT
jgi:signal transduction histidine kinase/CheY-like chemotaxis protein